MSNKKVVMKNIDSLIQAEYNPRQLTAEQYQSLKDSINRFGLVDPILINVNPDRSNIIIGGHQRVKVAKKLGMKEVPCLELNLTYEKERELNVRLNKNTGEWDFDVLGNFFDAGELLEWGFDMKELKFDEEETDVADLSDTLEEQYEVVIECDTEQMQEEVFNKISELGYKCRILTL